MRSVLTVLGITIGIAALICVVATGKAGQARVQSLSNSNRSGFGYALSALSSMS
jgi:ABC-type antimicrobial peptide transport system permease subunit